MHPTAALVTTTTTSTTEQPRPTVALTTTGDPVVDEIRRTLEATGDPKGAARQLMAAIGRTPTTPARTSFEQAIRAEVEVEIIRDPDTNTLDLIISTAIRQYEMCTSEEARAEAADLRDKADSIDKLADQWDAITALRDLLAERRAVVLPDEDMPDGTDTWYGQINATHTFMFDAALDPATRLRRAREAFARTEVTA
jgi:hypothetical protein